MSENKADNKNVMSERPAVIIEDCVPTGKTAARMEAAYVSCGETARKDDFIKEYTDCSMFKMRGGADISG